MSVSAAQKKATAKYEQNKYDKILLRLPKGTKERIQEKNKSVNGYITDLIIKDLGTVEQTPDTSAEQRSDTSGSASWHGFPIEPPF